MTYISLTQLETRNRLLEEERALRQTPAATEASAEYRPRPRGLLRIRRLLSLSDAR